MIVKDGMVKVRIRGVDKMVRDLAKTNEQEKIAVKRGIMKAAEYLMEKMRSKMGTYQSTGGTGGGPWARLTYESNMKKLMKYGFTNKPLIGSGAMKDSFEIIEGGVGTLAASVGSSDEKMVHHVYGAPKANLPPRDVMLVTATEEASKCREIILDEVYKAYK